MEDLIHVIYVGAASADLSEHDTVSILNDARKTNRSHDISGLMLYVGGCLLLLLEGEPAKVDSASRAIVSEGRDMRMILREPISERNFRNGSWDSKRSSWMRLPACSALRCCSTPLRASRA